MSSVRFQFLTNPRLTAVAASCLVAVTMLMGASQAAAQGNGRNSVPRSFEVVPITITGVALHPTDANQLVVSGLAGTRAFTTPLLVGVTPSQTGGCPILNLSLGAIDLNLLGLRVQTSDICLDVTAIPGGGLLGDLLCGVANLLSGGMPIGTAIAGLDDAAEARVLNGLASVLDQVFDRLTSNTANLTAGATCNILNLELGPLELNLLGLLVELDDCDDGPVTVDITAEPAGGLLGQLLCGLTNLLNGGAGDLSTAVQRLLFQISQLLGGALA